MTPAQLSGTVLSTVRRAVQDGELRVPVPGRVVVKPAARPGLGDYATAVALQLAKPAGLPARSVAEILRQRLAGTPGIERVDIAGPGFLNITLAGDTAPRLVRDILAAGLRYGHGDALAGQVHQLHCPYELRAVVTTDTLGRLLRSQGAAVRTSCEQVPDPAWAAALGVRLDAHGSPPVPLPAVRPVPVPARDGAAADPAALLPLLGPDALRWALLRPAAHDRPRTGDDLTALLAQRESNPLFRVRYAHARARALVRNAADLGIQPDPGALNDPGAVSGEARRLLAVLGEHPAVLASAARHRAPDRLARHLENLADAFFRFHDGCPVLPRGDEKPSAAHRARTALAGAAGTVLAGGLHLLGINAPEHL